MHKHFDLTYAGKFYSFFMAMLDVRNVSGIYLIRYAAHLYNVFIDCGVYKYHRETLKQTNVD